ncbi:hypothetical protein R6Q59_025724 [Mikania micrantha]|uniref:BHLH domain-containing protein n=1 Tax=Mikania micrantha TaxID=192012 RepID=A0A5N6PQX3_9ASTR|nr:hypothetical protein E3N88_46157 [Mikania micrantha]KAD6795876.1 hypothetical protein E3N88_06772 [Mikania micrantha]
MNNQNNNNNRLLRFRSAPSFVLQSFVNDFEKTRDENHGLNHNFVSQSLQDLQEEVDLKPNLIDGFALNSQFQNHYPRQMSSSMAMEIDNLEQRSKAGSNLFRQNSTPSGLFSHLNPSNGYGAMRGTVPSYRLENVGNSGDFSPSSSRIKRQIRSSSGVGVTSLGTLPRISEIETDTVEPGVFNESSGYPFRSWEHEPTSQYIDNFNGLKRELNLPNEDNVGNHQPMLSHHLSLPKTSGEMAAVEKLLHFQDSVPCKIRAKRGCATHPRSIAERVRRTRISERMRKLQELVPHMDKQTNTSDMLDLAVDYIKDLQEQYKVLKDSRANCRCLAK